MANKFARALAPITLVLLAGCQTLASGPSREIPPVDQAHLFPPDPSRTVLMAQDWTQYETPQEKFEARNEYATARMNFIDRAFHDYEQTFLQEVRSSGFLMDFIIAALGIGAASIRDAEIVRGLTTAGATATAGRTAFDKEVLMDRTLPTLLNQMRANRAEVKADILERLRLDYAQYPIGLAQSDVDEYYQAGTLVSALTAAADSASTRKIAEEENADVALTVDFQTDLFSEALRTFIRDGGDAAGRTARRVRAQRALDAQRIALGKRAGLPVVAFIENGSEADKKKLVQALHDDPEIDADAKKKLADALAGTAPAPQTGDGTTPGDAVTTETETAPNTAFTNEFQTSLATEAFRTYLRTGNAAERKRRRELAQKLFDAQRIATGKAPMPIVAFVERDGNLQDKDRLLQALWQAETGDAKNQLTELITGLNQ